jgi:Dyp-type peroxidase family
VSVAPHKHHVDQHDLQGNILCGYGNSFPYGVHLFVGIDDGTAGRRWLGELCDSVTTAVSWERLGFKPLETLNVAFTHRGLKKLGVPKAVRETFTAEFREGMHKRAARLGDVGESAPCEWEKGLKRPQMLVTVMAQTEPLRARRWMELSEHIEKTPGLTLRYQQPVELLVHADSNVDYAREHFGFADGFSQPAISGNAGPSTKIGMGTPEKGGRWSDVAPGEFVLGYPGEDRELPAAPAAPLGRNGSYMVVRKLRQKVSVFRDYLRRKAEQELADEGKAATDVTIAERQRRLAAKMIGRWQDGRSLVRSDRPYGQPWERLPDIINRFRYDQDPTGYRCPLGAHVRRANPRDALSFDGKLTKRHRLIRRGVPYGPPAYDPAAADHEPNGLFDPNVSDEPERGLLFVCFQANIPRQFELVQMHWLNDGDIFWLGGEHDLLAGDMPPSAPEDIPGEGRMTIQGRPPHFLTAPNSPFITTRGGGYFFAPGITALRALASGYWM